MKKSKVMAVTLLAAGTLLTGCGTATGGKTTATAGDVLGSVVGSATNPNTIGNILGSVLGINKPSTNDLYGTWNYYEPGVAFTSDNALARAGGEVAAGSIREKLSGGYDKFGISSSNTQLQFNKDNTFRGTVAGRSLSGTWTYNESEQKIMLKTFLFTFPIYVTRTLKGMSFTTESKRLLTVLQTVGQLTGNSNIAAIGELSKNYEGVRVGFDMRK